MRVLHVIPSIAPARGGPSVALPELCRGLSREGVHVDVVTTDDNGAGRMDVPLNMPVPDDGFVVRYFPRQTRFYTFSWPLTRWLAQNIASYDLVHIHALFSYAAIPAALIAARHRVPYVVRPLGTLNRWGMENRRPLLKRLSFALVESRILEHAAAIHFTSEQEQLEARAIGVEGRPAVIPLGLDLAAFDNPPSPQLFLDAYPHLNGRLIVLYLSRLDEKKGLDLLLPAFASLHAACREAALVVVGNGDKALVTRLKGMTRDLDVENDVFWTGFLGGQEKLAALAAAAMYVLPSYSENFGVAPVEAMAAGLPVVLSDQVAVSADVARSNSGLVVPCDVVALAAALERLALDPDLRRALGSNGRREAWERFSSATMTRNVLALYDSLLGSRAPGLVAGPV